MKKTYNQPTLKVVNIRTIQILAGSSVPVETKESGNPADAEARQGRFHSWDEDME